MGGPARHRSGRLPRIRLDRARLESAARSVVPDVLAAMEAAGHPQAPSWSVHHAQTTSTFATVVMLGPPERAPAAVLKLPHTSAGVASAGRERETLETLWADERLDRYRQLLPRPLATGEVRGRFFVVSTALPGASPLPLPPDPARVQRVQLLAARAAGDLHRRTASVSVVGEALLRRWVDDPIEVLRPLAGAPTWLPVKRPLDRLAHQLRESLVGRELTTGRIHGDLWLGNLLAVPDVDELTGIVDWDQSASDELLLHDLLHLLLYTRRLLRGRQLGELVRQVLGGDPWTPQEQAVLDAAGSGGAAARLEPTVPILLYWLRHTAAHVRQQPRRATPRLAVWGRRNVVPVLHSM